jgi:hypothetical protein
VVRNHKKTSNSFAANLRTYWPWSSGPRALENFLRSRPDAVSVTRWGHSLRYLIAFACLMVIPVSASHAQGPSLGTAASFTVLAGSTITNTGTSVINGNIGVSPGSAIVGFPPGIVNGAIYAADGVSIQAQLDDTTAYNSIAGMPISTNLSGQNLGGETLIAGVYGFNTSAQLTGTLTLNGQGNPNAVFIFNIGSSLTTANASSIVLINGAQARNIFFRVGSSATLVARRQHLRETSSR